MPKTRTLPTPKIRSLLRLGTRSFLTGRASTHLEPTLPPRKARSLKQAKTTTRTPMEPMRGIGFRAIPRGISLRTTEAWRPAEAKQLRAMMPSLPAATSPIRRRPTAAAATVRSPRPRVSRPSLTIRAMSCRTRTMRITGMNCSLARR